MNGEAAIAPGGIAAIARRDHVMQRKTLALWRRRPAGRAVHARQPPFRDDLRLRDGLEIDHAKDVVGEPVEMRRHIGIAPARPPQPVDAEAGHLEERDLAHLVRLRYVVDREAAAEFL